MIDGMALHHYSVIDWNNKSSATQFNETEYFTTMQRALHMEELVQRHSTIMDKYDPRKRIALVVDEWGGWYDVEPGTNPGFLYQQNTMRDAMIAGTTLNIFNNHCDRVRMANLAQTINVLQAVILTEEEKMLLTPTYHVMKMYNVHHDAVMLPIHLKTEDYHYGEQKLPAVSGSASRDNNGAIHISLVNIDARKTKSISMELRGISLSNYEATILTSSKLQDHNTFEHPQKVVPQPFDGFSSQDGKLKVVLPPFSVVVISAR